MKNILLRTAILCGIIIVWYSIWYFGGINTLRSQQWYFMREFLSTAYKLIWMVVPAILLFGIKGQKNYFKYSSWWTSIFIISILLIILAKVFYKDYFSTPQDTLALTYFYVIVVNSFCEEFTFRWVLLSELKKKYEPSTALLLQAFFFMIIHIPFYLFIKDGISSVIISLIVVFWIGWFLGYVQDRTQSLIYPILFHTLWNSVILFL